MKMKKCIIDDWLDADESFYTPSLIFNKEMSFSDASVQDLNVILSLDKSLISHTSDMTCRS